MIGNDDIEDKVGGGDGISASGLSILCRILRRSPCLPLSPSSSTVSLKLPASLSDDTDSIAESRIRKAVLLSSNDDGIASLSSSSSVEGGRDGIFVDGSLNFPRISSCTSSSSSSSDKSALVCEFQSSVSKFSLRCSEPNVALLPLSLPFALSLSLSTLLLCTSLFLLLLLLAKDDDDDDDDDLFLLL